MTDVLVVGGGIVGTSVAAAVAARGASVVLIEAGAPTEGSSMGNAGHLVPSHVIPFAAPGMVRAGLRSIARRDDAFAVRPSTATHPFGAPSVAGWLARFARASTTRNVERAAPALTALLDRSLETIRALSASGADLDLDVSGLLQVFSSERSWQAGRHEAETLRELGYPARELTSDEVADREPQIHGAVGGVLLERDGRVDPARLLAALRTHARDHGARVVDAAVVGVAERASGGASVSTTVDAFHAEQIVLAAGVWTPDLVRRAGGPALPIVPAKGYSTTLVGLETRINGPVLLMDQRLAATPLRQGLRITGRFELTRAGDRRIPARRIDSLVERARPVLGLPADTRPGASWSGLRPATPDGVPVIGRIAPDSPFVVASGHGMLGTAMGPGTGELVADILTGIRPSIDLGPLAPTRFARSRRSR